MPKYARWMSKRVDWQTIRTALCAGKKGTGQELGACSYWPDSWKSGEAHDRIQSQIERKAEEQGYSIVRDE